MTIPAVPGANLVVIETNFTFANFKALLNAPASTNCFCHLDKRCTSTSKDQKERLIWRFGSRGGDALSDDQPMPPSFCFRTAEFNPHPVVVLSLHSLHCVAATANTLFPGRDHPHVLASLRHQPVPGTRRLMHTPVASFPVQFARVGC